MLKNALRLAKYSAKLIIRNKAFLVIGILIPLLAPFLMNMWYKIPTDEKVETTYELKSIDEQMAYHIDFYRMPVKVYDTVCSDYSKNICDEIGKAGMFQMFRAECKDVPYDKIEKSYKKSALEDRVAAVIVLKEDPEETELFSVGDDERYELLEDTVSMVLANGPYTSDKSKVSLLKVSSGDDVDYFKTRNFSYSLAIGTLASIFGGVLVLGTVISEKRDNAYSRILLTKANKASYLLSKLILSIGTALFQSICMTISFEFLVKVDVGISGLQFFFVVLLTGLVFNLISLCGGIMFNSMAGASIMSFTIWSFSALVAGAYFDISEASETYQKAALLMPQRWALVTVTRFMNHDNSGYPLLLCVTLGYLVIMIVIGLLGLKVAEKE
ncbi:MAG: ABC transporter permease [Clostridiales bacterium]|nr:ABC transporter permease [Clostridiales bacterium]